MSTLNTKQKPPSCAIKHDTFKPPLGLIPKAALDEEAAVLAFGGQKYGLHNWRLTPYPWSEMISAAMRHLVDFNDGLDFDVQSGLHALAHVRARCGMLIEYMTTHPELDDRFKKSDTQLATNAVALQQQVVEKNDRVRRALESLAKDQKPDHSKSPPWLTK